MKITLELSESDLAYFRDLLRTSRAASQHLVEADVLGAAELLLRTVEQAQVPSFIAQRMLMLRRMIDMMRDQEFALADELRGSVVSALAYFSEPQDLIPDTVPVVGFLDDAIMIEIVRRELRPEIEAYEEFCSARDVSPTRVAAPQAYDDLIDQRRRNLFARIRERRDHLNDFG
ncbi:MAG: YkvA family protein [Myxococcota bacterium]|nr:YkvA family protein [Myxococcota bacterium]